MLKENIDHMWLVLKQLSVASIYLKLKKCKFHNQEPEVDYLSLVITPGSLKMQDEMVATICDWEDPQNVKNVESFLL